MRDTLRMNAFARRGVIFAILLVGAAVLAWHSITSFSDEPATPAAVTLSFPLDEAGAKNASGPLLPPSEAPSGMREYRNERHRFALFYPEALVVKEFDEG